MELKKGDELNIEKDGKKLKVRIIEVENKHPILPIGYPIISGDYYHYFGGISEYDQVLSYYAEGGASEHYVNATYIPEWKYDYEKTPRNGWFPHLDGKRPVHPQMKVDIILSSGVERKNREAAYCRWVLENADYDIIAYRVVSGQCLADFI